MSKITRTQVRTGTFVACIIVPVSTENCLRQSRHFHTRRSLIVPAAVLRLTPFAGGIRYTSGRHSGRTGGHLPQRRPSRCR